MFVQSMPIFEGLGASLTRARGTLEDLPIVGTVHFEHVREDVILEAGCLNSVTNVAKNSLLEAWFNTGTRYSSYYAGLVDASGFTAFQAADTMTSHSGWVEFTAFTFSGGSARATWGKGSSSGQAITNASPMIFDFTATGSVQGIFITPDSVKGGTSYVLWSTAAFSAPLAVQSGDQLRVTYSVQL